MSDILGDDPDSESDFAVEETGDGLLGDPTTLAFLAFPLAVATVLGRRSSGG